MRDRMPAPVLTVLTVLTASVGCYDIPDYAGLISQAMAGIPQNQTQGAPLVHGELTIAVPGSASVTVAPRYCRSGEPASFAGVDLVSDGADATLVRVVEDPLLGTRLRIERAGGAAPWILDAARCRTLAAGLHRTGVAINRVNLLQGSLVVDCTAEDGTVIAGQVHYRACHTSPEADAAVLAVTDGARIAALPLVPDAAEATTLPPALQGLRVLPTVRVVGATIDGETPEQARAACLEGTRTFVTQRGWVPVADAGAPHDLDIEFACSGHVVYRTVGAMTEIELPDASGPSVRIRSGGAEIATIPPAPRRWRCESPGTLAAREGACSARVGRYNDARLARMIAESAPLAAWSARRAAPP